MVTEHVRQWGLLTLLVPELEFEMVSELVSRLAPEKIWVQESRMMHVPLFSDKESQRVCAPEILYLTYHISSLSIQFEPNLGSSFIEDTSSSFHICMS